MFRFVCRYVPSYPFYQSHQRINIIMKNSEEEVICYLLESPHRFFFPSDHFCSLVRTEELVRVDELPTLYNK